MVLGEEYGIVQVIQPPKTGPSETGVILGQDSPGEEKRTMPKKAHTEEQITPNAEGGIPMSDSRLSWSSADSLSTKRQFAGNLGDNPHTYSDHVRLFFPELRAPSACI